MPSIRSGSTPASSAASSTCARQRSTRRAVASDPARALHVDHVAVARRRARLELVLAVRPRTPRGRPRGRAGCSSAGRRRGAAGSGNAAARGEHQRGRRDGDARPSGCQGTQGAPSHTSITAAADPQELGLLAAGGRAVPRRAVRVLALARRRVRDRRRRDAGVPEHERGAAERDTPSMRGMPKYGSTSCGGPGASAGQRTAAPIVRASTSAVTFATWWSPNATCSSTSCARRARQRVGRHVVRVAVRLAAVPEQLDQRQEQRPLELVRVVVVEPERACPRPRSRPSRTGRSRPSGAAASSSSSRARRARRARSRARAR